MVNMATGKRTRQKWWVRARLDIPGLDVRSKRAKIIVNPASTQQSTGQVREESINTSFFFLYHMENKKPLIKKSFFGKNNCFKFLLYQEGTIMFHFGTATGNAWQWKKVKMNDNELGEILLVLEGRKEETSFFHAYGEGKEKNTTQIWINSKEENGKKAFFIKVKELSKSFTIGEQRVLEALINHSILRTNLAL